MDSYLLWEKEKEKRGGKAKRLGLENGVKTRCNVIVWCYVSLMYVKHFLFGVVS